MSDPSTRAREVLASLLDVEQDGNGFGEYQVDRILAALHAAGYVIISLADLKGAIDTITTIQDQEDANVVDRVEAVIAAAEGVTP